MQLPLSSERLRLRLLTPGDWHDFLAMQTDPAVNRFVRPCEPLNVIEAKFAERLRPWSYDTGQWLTLLIETHAGDFVGYTGFHQQDAVSRRAEVGYLLTPTMHGQGYATEATRTVIDWGARNYDIHKFVAYCSEQNLASRRVLERLGFQLEGVLRLHSLIGEQWHNDCVYGFLAGQGASN